jgi:hypothetical protein
LPYLARKRLTEIFKLAKKDAQDLQERKQTYEAENTFRLSWGKNVWRRGVVAGENLGRERLILVTVPARWHRSCASRFPRVKPIFGDGMRFNFFGRVKKGSGFSRTSLPSGWELSHRLIGYTRVS